MFKHTQQQLKPMAAPVVTAAQNLLVLLLP